MYCASTDDQRSSFCNTIHLAASTIVFHDNADDHHNGTLSSINLRLGVKYEKSQKNKNEKK